MAIRTKPLLAVAALVLAFGCAAASTRTPSAPPSADVRAPRSIEPFALATLLAEAPPDVVVIGLDAPRHPLRGAVPIAALGGSDDALLASPPKRHVVIAAFDQVRADRLARRLLAKGADARVVDGGLDAWDRAMDADPEAPAASAPHAVWQSYRMRVALRRSFGDASLAPPTTAIVPVLPVAAPAGGEAKKREGC